MKVMEMFFTSFFKVVCVCTDLNFTFFKWSSELKLSLSPKNSQYSNISSSLSLFPLLSPCLLSLPPSPCFLSSLLSSPRLLSLPPSPRLPVPSSLQEPGVGGRSAPPAGGVSGGGSQCVCRSSFSRSSEFSEAPPAARRPRPPRPHVHDAAAL